jgi:hypothetical protein
MIKATNGDAERVRVWMGHSDTKTLLRCYSHEFEAVRGGRQIAREIAKMDAAFAGRSGLAPAIEEVPTGDRRRLHFEELEALLPGPVLSPYVDAARGLADGRERAVLLAVVDDLVRGRWRNAWLRSTE